MFSTLLATSVSGEQAFSSNLLSASFYEVKKDVPGHGWEKGTNLLFSVWRFNLSYFIYYLHIIIVSMYYLLVIYSDFHLLAFTFVVKILVPRFVLWNFETMGRTLGQNHAGVP